MLTASHLLHTAAQSAQDVEEIVDTSSVTGWDILIAVGVLAGSVPVSAAAGRVAGDLVRRLDSAPESAARLAGRAIRGVVLVVALAISLSRIGVNAEWFSVTIILMLLVAVLMLRPLVSNSTAGMLIESRPAFAVGDEITTNGYTGEVMAVTARTTIVRTRDWRRVHIPNTEVLDSPVVVFTALGRRRSELELNIDQDADLTQATHLIAQAASTVEGVHSEPAPYVLLSGFGAGTVTLLLRWWHNPDIRSSLRTTDGVGRAAKRALDEAGIRMPGPEYVIRHTDPDQP
jgi:small-conductance mechanosensitive channel